MTRNQAGEEADPKRQVPFHTRPGRDRMGQLGEGWPARGARMGGSEPLSTAVGQEPERRRPEAIPTLKTECLARDRRAELAHRAQGRLPSRVDAVAWVRMRVGTRNKDASGGKGPQRKDVTGKRVFKRPKFQGGGSGQLTKDSKGKMGCSV